MNVRESIDEAVLIDKVPPRFCQSFDEKALSQVSREGQIKSSVTLPSLATSSRFLTGVLSVTSHSSTVIQTDSAPPS
nr:unnamed protein product [Callosobruchus chinensis]